jgi:low temperature requirement protein LtrA
MADPLAEPSVPASTPEERSATWLELFFDVIFVINIAGLTHHLVAHPDLHALGQVAVLYVPLFLVWACPYHLCDPLR